MHRTWHIANSRGEHREYVGALRECAEEHLECLWDDRERSGIDGESLGDALYA